MFQDKITWCNVFRHIETCVLWQPERVEWGNPLQWDYQTRLEFLHLVRLWSEYGYLHLTPRGLHLTAGRRWRGVAVSASQAAYFNGFLNSAWALLDVSQWGENAPKDNRLDYLAWWWLYVESGLAICATINADIACSEFNEAAPLRCEMWI